MDITRRLDAELAAVVQAAPAEGLFDWADLDGTRAAFEQRTAQLRGNVPDSDNVVKEDHRIPGPEGGPDVPIRIYRPKEQSSGSLAGLLWIPGGGYVLGGIEQNDLAMQHVVEEVGCVVVSVDYRRAPENPFPAPLDDCYTTLGWMANNASEIGLDPARIAVGGASAGGGLCAGLALLVRDRGEFGLVFQMLIYPMLDDRNCTYASQEITDPRIWNREANLFGWRCYVGESAGGEGVSQYAAATRATDLSGLPQTYIAVGSQDLFVDEDVEYAQKLIRAGVPTELHVYPGAFHGFDGIVPNAVLSKRFVADRTGALGRALNL